MPKSKGEKSRDLIVEKATILLARKGFDQTSFQEIADECGVSQATPIYHFRSKEGLFRAVVESIRKNKQRLLQQNVEMKDDAFDRLLKYFRGHLNWAEVYRYEAGVFLQLHHFASFDSGFAAIYQEIAIFERREIESLIVAGQREKIFLPKQPTSLLAEILHDCILGVVTNLLAGRGQLHSPRLLERKSKLMIQKILDYEI